MIYKYLLILGLCLGTVPLFGIFNYIFLVNSQEFVSADNIVKIQSKNGALYSPIIHNIYYPYKLSLFKQVKPGVVAMGSSRVWQIRGSYFTVPFVNLGGAIGSLKGGEQLLKEMVASHKPEVVIMGLDPWWFCSAGEIDSPEHYDRTGEEFRVDMVFLPCDWLLKGTVSLPYYCQVLLGKNPRAYPTIGVRAGTLFEGFYKDGSFYNFGIITGLYSSPGNRRFVHFFDEIRKGKFPFRYYKEINKDRWKDFVSLIQFAQKEKIHLITFLTPLPSQIIDVMIKMTDNYAYINELRLKLLEVNERYYDFYDPRNFGSSDCEFIDGVHGGEITYLRILQEIGQDLASGLSPYLNLDKIVTCIDQYRGKAMVPPPFYKQPYTEGDFLDLGCKKH
jgi:hypothetical protein